MSKCSQMLTLTVPQLSAGERGDLPACGRHTTYIHEYISLIDSETSMKVDLLLN